MVNRIEHAENKITELNHDDKRNKKKYNSPQKYIQTSLSQLST